MWSATLIDQAGADSFDGISIDDAQGIILEVNKLADRMLGNRPYILTLPRIIEWVLSNK